jgi:hypothetical protein
VSTSNLNWNTRRNIPGPDTVKAALTNALERVDQEGFNKAFIVLLDDSTGAYLVGWSNAGMHISECVALLEVAKQRIIKEEMLL